MTDPRDWKCVGGETCHTSARYQIERRHVIGSGWCVCWERENTANQNIGARVRALCGPDQPATEMSIIALRKIIDEEDKR